MAVLKPIMASLGFTDVDVTGKNKLVIVLLDGSNSLLHTHTFTVPAAGSPIFNDRYSADRFGAQLTDALNAAEAAWYAAGYGAATTWTNTVDLKGAGNVVLGYDTWTRSAGGKTVGLRWTDASTTLPGAWLGFDDTSDTSISSSALQLISDWQPQRLWLPGDRVPIRWESTEIKVGKVRRTPIGGRVKRFGHGTWTVWTLEMEKVDALFVYKDRVADAAHRGHRPGVAADDIHVSWEGGCWTHLYATEAPLRVFPDRDDPTTYTDVQIVRKEELDDLREVFEEESKAFQRYRFRWHMIEDA